MWNGIKCTSSKCYDSPITVTHVDQNPYRQTLFSQKEFMKKLYLF